MKWKGYRAQTWEPEASLSEDVPDMVQEYQQSLLQQAERTAKSNVRATRSRTAAAQSSSSSQVAAAAPSPEARGAAAPAACA